MASTFLRSLYHYSKQPQNVNKLKYSSAYLDTENMAIHKWGICYSAIRKKNGVLSLMPTCLKLGNIMLQEISKEKKTRKSGWGRSSFGGLFANMNKSQYSFLTIT